ncbi:amidase family protein [Mycoplasmopsis gallinarum]|uniref:amidase family protein n=1 Tax=Mycoplasmopsis gallinarum TaxID=29557 RepID=UPI0004830942|nr:amidase family protein [Mycoplasmopsis gallinarum]
MTIKNLGNFQSAIKELKENQNNCVLIVNENAHTLNSNGILANAVFTVKDNYATKDFPTTSSSKILENFSPFYNATVIEKLLNAGALMAAKVNLDELALGGTGTFSANGLIRNPLDPSRLAGGSSSGSVVTLTNNISFALGSDTGDSVRLPASYNGKVGFKPSYGAISRYGLFAYSSSLDTVAYFAHNVNDIAMVSQALFGKDNKDFTSLEVKIDQVQKIKPKKIAFLDLAEFINPDLASKYEELFNLLNEDSEIEIVKIKPEIKYFRAIKPIYQIISFSEASSNLSNLNGIAFGERQNGKDWSQIMTNTRSVGFGEMVQWRLTLGSYFLHAANQKEIFIKAQKARRAFKNYINEIHKNYDLVIYPASADVAPLIEGPNKNYGFMEYILTGANLIGNPSITIPFIKINNLPINLALDSEIYSDEKLLSYSLWMEELIENNFNGGRND